MSVGPLSRAEERLAEERRAFNENRAPDFSEENLAGYRPAVPEGEPEVAQRVDEDMSEPMAVTTTQGEEPEEEAAVETETETETPEA